MREFINKHGKIVAGVCLVLAVLVAVVFSRKSTPTARENPSYGFYVDEVTGEEAVHPVVELPPLQGKGGDRTMVRAFKFTCDDGKTVQVGYYMKYPSDVQAALLSMGEDDVRRPRLLESAPLVRLPQPGSPWVPSQSEAGQKIMQGPNCEKGTQRMVHPEL